MSDFLEETNMLLNCIEKNTVEHWENYYKDVPIDCIYEDLVIDINEIKRLQQEVEKWKSYTEITGEEGQLINNELQQRINETCQYIEGLEDSVENFHYYDINKSTKRKILKLLKGE